MKFQTEVLREFKRIDSFGEPPTTYKVPAL
jgi:hypothetical protein